MPNETLRTVHSLRSIHGNFSDREVSREDLQTILCAAVQAATASGRQSYSIVVVDDKPIMKNLGYVGSRVLVFCVDFTRLFALAETFGYVFQRKGVEDFITGSTDTILAAQTAAIAAKSLGIDSLFTNCVHRGDISRVYRLLGLPADYCFPLIALVLGYPKSEPCEAKKKGRLCGPGVIHFGSYHRATAEEINDMVLRYDDPQTHFLSLIDHWRSKGYPHYLEYFFTQWCKYRKSADQDDAPRERATIDERFVALLRSTGFLGEI